MRPMRLVMGGGVANDWSSNEEDASVFVVIGLSSSFLCLSPHSIIVGDLGDADNEITAIEFVMRDICV